MTVANMSRDALEVHAFRLELELEHERARALEAAASAGAHFSARLRAEAEAVDARRAGIRTAIAWVRTMPRTRLGDELVQRCAELVARYLEERLEACDEPTRPTLPPSSG